jgi:hypothetical protein
MSCSICGSHNCTRSFHSLEEQQDYDDKKDAVKEDFKRELLSGLSGLKEYYTEEDLPCYSCSDVEALIDDIFW